MRGAPSESSPDAARHPRTDAGYEAGYEAGTDPGADADAEERARAGVLRSFLGADGRLRVMPARRAKRLAVLDHLAQVFEPGVRYPEVEVNRLLRAVHDDVAMVRRYLVDEGFLGRENGSYWRVGGSVEV